MNEVVKTLGEFDELQKLLSATDKADPTPQALQALRKFLSAHPGSCRALGDLALQVTEQIINHAIPKTAGVVVSLKFHMKALRDDLGYDDASAMEKMLIENSLLCWLRLYVTESRYEMHMESNELVLSQCRYWEDKLSVHQSRYLRSIEALARVRRLLKEPKSPALNLLLAQQINNHR